MEIQTLLPLAGVLATAAITPGPNNFMVMDAGGRSGMAAAGTVVIGVILGSLALLAVTWAGLDRALQDFPIIRMAIGFGGAVYLAWLGASLIVRRSEECESANQPRALPQSLLGVAAFQLLNPKAWMLIATASATVSGERGVLQLGALLVLITAACLSLWALAGKAFYRHLERPRARLWFNRTSGGLLAASALGILFNALD